MEEINVQSAINEDGGLVYVACIVVWERVMGYDCRAGVNDGWDQMKMIRWMHAERKTVKH